MLQKQIGIDKPLEGIKIDKKFKDYKDASQPKMKIFDVQWKNLKKIVMPLAETQINRIKVSFAS